MARAIEAADLGIWQIDLATDLALTRSQRHDQLFGHEAPQKDWGFAAAARQVIDDDRPAFLAAVAEARRTGLLRCAIRVRWPDGSVHGLEFRGRTLAGPDGTGTLMAGTVADIGGRLATEARLHESELQLRLAQAVADIGLFEWDIAAGTVTYNDELLRIYGIDRAAFDGRYESWRPTVMPEDLARLEASLAGTLARREANIRLDFRIRRPDGEIRQVECIAALTYGPDGTPLRGIGVNRDRTDAIRQLHALHESQERDRALFEQAAVGIIDADLEGNWIRVNHRLAAMLGYDSSDELRGRSWVDLTHPDDLAAGREQIAALKAGRIAYRSGDKRFLRKDGAVIWANATVSLVRDTDTGRPSFLTSVVVDATDRKMAEAALMEAEERLRFALDAAGAGLWNLDVASGDAACSDGYCRLYGLDPAGPGHRTTEEWLAQVHHEDRERARSAVEASFAEGGYFCEYRIVRTDGAVRWLAAHGRTHLDAAGRPTRFTGLVVDVTTLREAELSLRMAIDATGLATWERVVATGDARWSQNHFPLLGYRPDPAGRASFAMWRDRVLPEYRPSIEATLAGCRDGDRFDIVYRIRRADDGAERWLQTIGRAFGEDGDGQPRRMLGVTIDVTDREVARARLQTLQDELLHVSRLADAGVMASGLVHELAQPLTAAALALQGAWRLARRAADGLSADLRRDLDEAHAHAESQIARAGAILEGLRGFIEPRGAVRRSEALPPLVEDARLLAMVGFSGSDVAVRNAIPAGTPHVLANGAQLRQLLFNLLRNAIQAMAEQPTAPVPRTVTVSAAVREGMVEVEVADNGPGLPPKVAAQLFEPFVTTKPDGMGIGLSLCRSIVEAHGGSIRAEANAGGGTVFRFTLPIDAPDGRPHNSEDLDASHGPA